MRPVSRSGSKRLITTQPSKAHRASTKLPIPAGLVTWARASISGPLARGSPRVPSALAIAWLFPSPAPLDRSMTMSGSTAAAQRRMAEASMAALRTSISASSNNPRRELQTEASPINSSAVAAAARTRLFGSVRQASSGSRAAKLPSRPRVVAARTRRSGEESGSMLSMGTVAVGPHRASAAHASCPSRAPGHPSSPCRSGSSASTARGSRARMGDWQAASRTCHALSASACSTASRASLSSIRPRTRTASARATGAAAESSRSVRREATLV